MLMVKIKTRCLTWQYQRAQRIAKKMHQRMRRISEAQARTWYRGEVLRCRRSLTESR